MSVEEKIEAIKNIGNKEPIIVTYKGYTGKAYGVSSYSIYGPEGKEIYHTGYTTEDIENEGQALIYLKETLKFLEESHPSKSLPMMCDYEKGLREGWELARLLRNPENGGLYTDDRQKIFGYRESDKILTELEAPEALSRYYGYMREKENVHEGDEVTYVGEDGRMKRYVITTVQGDNYGWMDEDGHTGCFQGMMFKKTGRSFPQITYLKDALSFRCAK